MFQSLTETLETKEIDLGTNATSSSNPVRITGLKATYAVGDELRLTCSYRGDEEEVVMHWLVNDKRVQPLLVIRYKHHNYIGLKMVIEKRDLNHQNELLVRCVASKFLYRVRRKAAASSGNPLMTSDATQVSIACVIIFLAHMRNHK